MSFKNNNNSSQTPLSEAEDFDAILKSIDDMDPEEARIMFQNIVSAMDEAGDVVPLPLRLLTSDVFYGYVDTSVGIIYGIGGLGQLMLTGFITQEDIDELGDTESVLEAIMDDFQDTIPTATLVRNDEIIGELIHSALEGSYQVNFEIFDAIDATDLQRAVWIELTKIPYGTTISYEELALRVGNPKAVRAIATCVGDNPISIAVPCHRIILKSGEIGQYHWGSDIKEKLLAYEKAKRQA